MSRYYECQLHFQVITYNNPAICCDLSLLNLALSACTACCFLGEADATASSLSPSSSSGPSDTSESGDSSDEDEDDYYYGGYRRSWGSYGRCFNCGKYQCDLSLLQVLQFMRSMTRLFHLMTRMRNILVFLEGFMLDMVLAFFVVGLDSSMNVWIYNCLTNSLSA